MGDEAREENKGTPRYSLSYFLSARTAIPKITKRVTANKPIKQSKWSYEKSQLIQKKAEKKGKREENIETNKKHVVLWLS